MLPELWTMPGTGWTLKSYGFMMTVGFLSGVYLAMRRAMRVKCDPDVVLNCSLIALFSGVVGARIFYVLHYWNESFADIGGALPRAMAIINITQGGLEFIGGLLAAAFCIIVYLRLKGYSVRVYLDILVVSTMWSLGVARIGCFLNGCCHGGVCTTEQNTPAVASAVEFPFASPALVRQWENRQVAIPAELIIDNYNPMSNTTLWENMPLSRDLLYMPVDKREKPIRDFEQVQEALRFAQARDPNSDETKELKSTLEERKLIKDRHEYMTSHLRWAQQFPSRDDPSRLRMTVGELQALADQFPARWVHPTQLYSSLHAIVLSILLGRVFHRRKRHGLVFGLMLVTYPVGRFLLEIIRADNPLDTLGLTISQAICVGMFIVGVIYLVFIYRFLPERSPRAIAFVPADDQPQPAPA